MISDFDLLKSKAKIIYPDKVTALASKDLDSQVVIGLNFNFFRFDAEVSYSMYAPDYGEKVEKPFWCVFGFKTLFSNN